MKPLSPPHETDRVRLRTPGLINARIDYSTARRIEDCAARPHIEIACNICGLDDEWDIDRAVHLANAALAVPGLDLAAGTGHKGWLALPAAAAVFALQLVYRGAGLPVRLLRRAGVRTRREIDFEKYALKSLRGDFELVSETKSLVARAGTAMQAASHP